MPIYEYQCQACGAILEEFQKVSDAPLKKCPECGKNKLEKQVSASAFHLKGSGWYVTDFKDKKSSKDQASESSSTTKTEKSKTTTKKESKPKSTEKK